MTPPAAGNRSRPRGRPGAPALESAPAPEPARSSAPSPARARAGSRSRSRRVDLLVAVLVPLAFFGVLEGGARLVEGGEDAVAVGGEGLSVPGWVARDPALAAGLTHLDQIPADLDRRAIFEFWTFYRRDPDLHYRLRPGLRTRTVNTFLPRDLAVRVPWTITSNDDGFRGPRLPPAAAAAAGTRLVVCLGDSTTYGWGVEEEQTFAARLEGYLAAAGGAAAGGSASPTAWRVFNLGHPGYTTWQGLRLLDRVEPLRPDAVVVTFGGNDGSSGGLTDRELWERDRTLPARAARAAEHLAFYRALNRLVLSAWTPAAAGSADDRGVALVQRVPPAEFRENLALLVARVRAWGGTPIVLGNIETDPYRGALREVSSAGGALYRETADLYAAALPELRSRRAYAAEIAALEARLGPLEQAPLFYTRADPGHPNAIGHDLIARHLARILLAGRGAPAALPPSS